MHPQSVTYSIKVDGVFVKEKNFKKTGIFKGYKLYTRSGWVNYLMFIVRGKKFELFAKFL